MRDKYGSTMSRASYAPGLDEWVTRRRAPRTRVGLVFDVFFERRTLSEAFQVAISVVSSLRGVTDELVHARDDHQNEWKREKVVQSLPPKRDAVKLPGFAATPVDPRQKLDGATNGDRKGDKFVDPQNALYAARLDVLELHNRIRHRAEIDLMSLARKVILVVQRVHSARNIVVLDFGDAVNVMK